MSYLVCSTVESGSVQYDYTEISTAQEQKIGSLIRLRTIPSRFKLGDKEIVSDTIVGFSDKPLPPNGPPKFKSWDEFRAWVKQQKWYQSQKSGI